jgi:hypothetical protein
VPDFFGDWVNDDTEPLSNDCRLTPTRLTTVNNWMTTKYAIAEEVWDNISNDPVTWDAYWPSSGNQDNCRTQGLPSPLVPGTLPPCKIYWRVRPVYELSSTLESAWLGGPQVIYGRWLDYELGGGGAKAYEFDMTDPGAVATTSVANGRCPSPDNVMTDECLLHDVTAMYANDSNFAARPSPPDPAAAAPNPVGGTFLDWATSNSLQVPVMKWFGFPGATGYVVQISRDPNFSTTEIVREEYVPVFLSAGGGWAVSHALTTGLPDNAEDTGYYWRAVPCYADPPPGNTEPGPCSPVYFPGAGGSYTSSSDGAQDQKFWKDSGLTTDLEEDFSGATPLLEWFQSNRSATPYWGSDSSYYYEVQMSRSPLMTSPITFKTTVPRLLPFEGTGAAPTELGDGTWHWRVRAVDASAQMLYADDTVYGAWSDIATFEKRVPAPTIPNSAMEVSDKNPVMHWNPVTGADYYQVQWSTSTSFGSAKTKTTAQTSYLVPSTTPECYYWRARAVLGTVEGRWSNASAAGPLACVEVPAGFTYDTSQDIVNAKGRLFVDGLLTINGRGSNDRTVQLLRKSTACNVAGSYRPVDAQVTGEDGEEGVVRFGLNIDRNRCLRLAWDGGGSNVVYSAPIPIGAQPVLKLKTSANRVRRGKKFGVTLTSNTPISCRVRYQYKRGSKWRTAKTATLRAKRRHSFKLAINYAGRFRLRAMLDNCNTTAGYEQFVNTLRTGPKLRVNDLWGFYTK